MLLSFCLLGVRRHDGARECIVSFLFLSLLVWGSKNWEGIRDPLAKWIGEGSRNSYFLEHGIWLLGGGCRQGCRWCICRENAYAYFVFPKVQYWRPLVCKSCFQVLRLPAKFRLSPTFTSPCSRLAQELTPNYKEGWLHSWRTGPRFKRVSNPVPSYFQPGSSPLSGENLTFTSMQNSPFQFPLPF